MTGRLGIFPQSSPSPELGIFSPQGLAVPSFPAPSRVLPKVQALLVTPLQLMTKQNRVCSCWYWPQRPSKCCINWLFSISCSVDWHRDGGYQQTLYLENSRYEKWGKIAVWGCSGTYRLPLSSWAPPFAPNLGRKMWTNMALEEKNRHKSSTPYL